MMIKLELYSGISIKSRLFDAVYNLVFAVSNFATRSSKLICQYDDSTTYENCLSMLQKLQNKIVSYIHREVGNLRTQYTNVNIDIYDFCDEYDSCKLHVYLFHYKEDSKIDEIVKIVFNLPIESRNNTMMLKFHVYIVSIIPEAPITQFSINAISIHSIHDFIGIKRIYPFVAAIYLHSMI